MYNKFKKLICIILTCAILLTGTVFSSFAYDAALANSIYQANTIGTLTSKSYVLIDVSSGISLLGKNQDEKYSIGYMVKIMTLLLVFDSIKAGELYLDSNINVSKNAQAAGNKGLNANKAQIDAIKNERVSVLQCLQAIGICSANDAAYLLAERIGGGSEEAFVVRMNEKAKALGMNNTLFVDSTGLNKTDQYSTAKDVAIMSQALISNYPEVLEYTKVNFGYFEHTTTGLTHTMMVSTNNLLKFYSGSDGLMSSYSLADGYSCSGTISVEGTRLLAVVIGATNEETELAEIKTLIRYGFKEFERITIDEAGTFVRSVPIKNGVKKKITAATATSFSTILKKDDFDRVKRSVVLDEDIKAPVQEGVRVGDVVYFLDDVEIGRVEIVTSQSMKKAGWFTRLIRTILSWLGLD